MGGKSCRGRWPRCGRRLDPGERAALGLRAPGCGLLPFSCSCRPPCPRTRPGWRISCCPSSRPRPEGDRPRRAGRTARGRRGPEDRVVERRALLGRRGRDPRRRTLAGWARGRGGACPADELSSAASPPNRPSIVFSTVLRGLAHCAARLAVGAALGRGGLPAPASVPEVGWPLRGQAGAPARGRAPAGPRGRARHRGRAWCRAAAGSAAWVRLAGSGVAAFCFFLGSRRARASGASRRRRRACRRTRRRRRCGWRGGRGRGGALRPLGHAPRGLGDGLADARAGRARARGADPPLPDDPLPENLEPVLPLPLPEDDPLAPPPDPLPELPLPELPELPDELVCGRLAREASIPA